MQSWLDTIQAAIAYIEENLTEELDVHAVAARAYVSAFHFQRIFSGLCGMPLGEYIRRRRLTLAAHDLTQGMKVIDAAVKYGYDCPDSFARAFRRFHGVLPSQAGQPGVVLQSFSPMNINLKPEGGSMLEYKIVEKPPFTVVGYTRKFSTDTSYQEIPRYWQEVMEMQSRITGAFGVCFDSDGKHFDYLIADMYVPWEEIPADCVTRVIPGSTWAVFPCRGALPDALQSVNTRIWAEWVPGCKAYKLAGSYNIEVYAPPAEKPEDNYCEIWVPVKPV
ncbi:MAG: AraC family transcriptional regulator [Clostridia bacterium]|nr:AraC family transcriptional regulator [Clostridia bacterium]